MRLNDKVRKVSGLFMIMLVVGMILVTPTMACPAGINCSSEKKLKAAGFSEITGIEKDEAILFTSNLEEVKMLSINHSVEDLKQVSDSAKVYSFESKMEDGSTDHVIAVTLPIELTIKDEEIKSKNILVLWNNENNNNENTKVMRYTSTIKNGYLYELTFGRVDNNGEILNEFLVSNGSLVKDRTGEFSVDDESGYWDCVIETISGDCLCLFLGDSCPPGLPSICDLCGPFFGACVSLPSQVSCAPLAACLGAEILSAMWQCS